MMGMGIGMGMPASSDGMVPEMDENGEYLWRNIWCAFLRLRISATHTVGLAGSTS